MADGQVESLWTIDELAAKATVELSRSGVGQQSRRVAAIPNLRTVRFYTTHGLLDRPLAFRGRTALYGRRHLLQLVAIKVLQARGLSLVEVQKRLLGLDDGALAKLAGLVLERDGGDGSRSDEGGAFWREAPVDAEVAHLDADSREPRSARIEGVEVAEGVVVLLQGAERDLYDDDVDAIKAAAAPLIKLLRARRLVAARSTQGGTDHAT